MNFIDTKEMTNDTAPSGQVLVQYLEPSFGYWSVEFAIGYYDNPRYYEREKDARGWLLWHNDKKINVIAYAFLPDKIQTSHNNLNQVEFKEKHGNFYPNNGSVGIE